MSEVRDEQVVFTRDLRKDEHARVEYDPVRKRVVVRIVKTLNLPPCGDDAKLMPDRGQ